MVCEYGNHIEMRPRFRCDLVSQSLWFDENAFGAPIYTPDLQIKALNNELIAYEKIQRYEFVLEFGIYVARRISIANASRLEENLIGIRPRRDF